MYASRITVPVFLHAMMDTTMIAKTRAAISKMLRVTEMIIAERMLLLSCPGVWVAVCVDVFVMLSCLECIDENLRIYHTLTNIPSIVEYTTVAI